MNSNSLDLDFLIYTVTGQHRAVREAHGDSMMTSDPEKFTACDGRSHYQRQDGLKVSRTRTMWIGKEGAVSTEDTWKTPRERCSRWTPKDKGNIDGRGSECIVGGRKCPKRGAMRVPLKTWGLTVTGSDQSWGSMEEWNIVGSGWDPKGPDSWTMQAFQKAPKAPFIVALLCWCLEMGQVIRGISGRSCVTPLSRLLILASW